MTNSPNELTNPYELTIENSVLVLIDHQPAVAVNVTSIDHGLLINNTAALAHVANWASPERALVSSIDSKRGGTTASLMYDWIMAQITAGVVSLPDSLAASITAGPR